MLRIAIEKAARAVTPQDWVIRCSNHPEGYTPLMAYDFQADKFTCGLCGFVMCAEDIYWSLPKVSDGNKD